jgi:hypothetical protein
MERNAQDAIEEPFKKSLGKNTTAQGAIEYLLIIGAAILIVAVVIIALVSVAGTATDRADEGEVDDATLIMQCQAECMTFGTDSNWVTELNKCEISTDADKTGTFYDNGGKCVDFEK